MINHRSLFVWMYAGLGLSIGLIVGLTQTSTSNTLLELVAAILAGGAGLYFFLEVDPKQKSRLEDLGKIGLVFLASFWVGWGGSHWFSNWQVNKWAAGVDSETRLVILEIEANAKMLGISPHTYNTVIQEALDATLQDANLQRCVFQQTASYAIAQAAITFLNKAESCQGESTPLAAQLNLLKGVEVFETARGFLAGSEMEIFEIGREDFTSAMDYYKAATSIFPVLSDPVGLLCESDTPDVEAKKQEVEAKVQAMIFADYLNNCQNSPIVALRGRMRIMAQQFSATWEESAPDTSAAIRMEAFRSK